MRDVIIETSSARRVAKPPSVYVALATSVNERGRVSVINSSISASSRRATDPFGQRMNGSSGSRRRPSGSISSRRKRNATANVSKCKKESSGDMRRRLMTTLLRTCALSSSAQPNSPSMRTTRATDAAHGTRSAPAPCNVCAAGREMSCHEHERQSIERARAYVNREIVQRVVAAVGGQLK